MPPTAIRRDATRRALTIGLLAGLAACGSDYSLEQQTPPNVPNGTYKFTPDGSTGDGAASGADGGGATVDAGDRGGTPDLCLACSGNSDCVAGSCETAACVAGCCKVAAAEPGSACDDGLACTGPDLCGAAGCAGPPLDCDDGLSCTTDACDAAAGGCSHAIADGFCAIDDACVEASAAKPGAPCQLCDPTKDAKAWSDLAGCCQVDGDCKTTGVCDAPTCDTTTSTCVPGTKLGCCTSDKACDDGDLCTLDSCDLATGVCSITPKACADASSCELGVCDASTGLCTTQVAANQCAIAGSCLAGGAINPLEPCLTCQPLVSQTQWSSAVGQACDDGEPCTLDDACSPKGACLGTFKPGCCKNDGDCQTLASACVTATCQVAANVCVTNEVPGCCDSGACCDVTTKSQKPKGTMCSATIVVLDFACEGQAIRRRELYPGCTGQSATICSSDGAYLFAGDWTTVQTCPQDTVCTPTGSGQQPTCKPKGTCVGACGGWASGNACSCSPGCEAAGTCCSDYKQVCACSSGACCDGSSGTFLAKGAACGSAAPQYQCSGATVQKRDGVSVCSGAAATCPSPTYGAWSNVQTCPSGTTCTAAANGSSASCTGSTNSCSGKCGGQGSGACWCDDACSGFGDCCADYVKLCKGCGSITNSCNNKCGGQGVGGCWCDSACATLGDCCADKPACCG